MTCDRLIAYFGRNRIVSDLRSDDFEGLRASIATTRGLVALGTEIQRVRTIFKYGYNSELLPEPIRFGEAFDKPTPKAMRIERARQGEKMLEAAELRRLIDNATPQLKCMILLALNGGYGNADCASLPIEAINLETGWINFPRPKTGVQRKTPLKLTFRLFVLGCNRLPDSSRRSLSLWHARFPLPVRVPAIAGRCLRQLYYCTWGTARLQSSENMA